MFLGSGSRLGAAREAALKMVEMTAGGVPAAADTFLGLRHGPMSSVHADTLVICFLASDPVTRAYELDVIRELNQKQLGTRLIIGDHVPADVVRNEDAVLDCCGLARAGDELAATPTFWPVNCLRSSAACRLACGQTHRRGITSSIGSSKTSPSTTAMTSSRTPTRETTRPGTTPVVIIGELNVI